MQVETQRVEGGPRVEREKARWAVSVRGEGGGIGGEGKPEFSELDGSEIGERQRCGGGDVRFKVWILLFYL